MSGVRREVVSCKEGKCVSVTRGEEGARIVE